MIQLGTRRVVTREEMPYQAAIQQGMRDGLARALFGLFGTDKVTLQMWTDEKMVISLIPRDKTWYRETLEHNTATHLSLGCRIWAAPEVEERIKREFEKKQLGGGA